MASIEEKEKSARKSIFPKSFEQLRLFFPPRSPKSKSDFSFDICEIRSKNKNLTFILYFNYYFLRLLIIIFLFNLLIV